MYSSTDRTLEIKREGICSGALILANIQETSLRAFIKRDDFAADIPTADIQAIHAIIEVVFELASFVLILVTRFIFFCAILLGLNYWH